MSVYIHATVKGSGPHVVLMHGLFGMGNNLGALARALAGHYTVHSVDLPNHGRSAWTDSADIAGMARSIAAWMDEQGLETPALVGHSLGGKVAMEIALRQPQRVAALVVADIAPVAYPASHGAEFAALAAVAKARCSSRSEAAAIMARHLEGEMVIQFLLTNLARDPEGIYLWRFNLDVLQGGYDAIRAAPAAGPPYEAPVLFIKGGESNYIRENDRDEIRSRFPAAELKVMPGCGHWLHAEQPRLFNSIVGRFLKRAVLAKGE